MYKIEFAAPEFFQNPEKAKMEENAGTGRIYFLLGARIVAVARRVP